MSDVPTEIVREILVRLPAESLFLFRCVCKSWLCIIDDPSFITAHTNNQVYYHTLLVRNQTGDPLYSFSLDSLNFIKGPQEIDTTRIKLGFQLNLYSSASCNGLILISQLSRWTIWNPLTGECHKLPRPKFESSELVFGFGYDRDADDYKVVTLNKFYSSGKYMYLTVVYSLKWKSWTRIEDCPFTMWDSRGTFWKGSLYWSSMGCIIALDLRTETYCQLPLPPSLEIVSSYGFHLEALDGCLLCSLSNHRSENFHGWVLKDNGVKKSWIKLFSFPIPANINTALGFRLVAYLLSKQQVLVQHHSGFLWFDIGNNSVLKFSIQGINYIHSSRICPGSLVRLNRTIGQRAVTATKTLTRKRKRNTKITDKRLKFYARDV